MGCRRSASSCQRLSALHQHSPPQHAHVAVKDGDRQALTTAAAIRPSSVGHHPSSVYCLTSAEAYRESEIAN